MTDEPGRPRLDLDTLPPDQQQVMDELRQCCTLILLKRLGGAVTISEDEISRALEWRLRATADEEAGTLTFTLEERARDG